MRPAIVTVGLGLILAIVVVNETQLAPDFAQAPRNGQTPSIVIIDKSGHGIVEFKDEQIGIIVGHRSSDEIDDGIIVLDCRIIDEAPVDGDEVLLTDRCRDVERRYGAFRREAGNEKFWLMLISSSDWQDSERSTEVIPLAAQPVPDLETPNQVPPHRAR